MYSFSLGSRENNFLGACRSIFYVFLKGIRTRALGIPPTVYDHLLVQLSDPCCEPGTSSWAINAFKMIDTPGVGLILNKPPDWLLVTPLYPPDWILVIRPLFRPRLQCGFYGR